MKCQLVMRLLLQVVSESAIREVAAQTVLIVSEFS